VLDSAHRVPPPSPQDATKAEMKAGAAEQLAKLTADREDKRGKAQAKNRCAGVRRRVPRAGEKGYVRIRLSFSRRPRWHRLVGREHQRELCDQIERDLSGSSNSWERVVSMVDIQQVSSVSRNI